MLNKRWITLPVVYRRPFTSKAVFERFWRILSSPFTVPKSYKITQKTVFDAKGRQYTTGKTIQTLFNNNNIFYLNTVGFKANIAYGAV